MTNSLTEWGRSLKHSSLLRRRSRGRIDLTSVPGRKGLERAVSQRQIEIRRAREIRS